MGADQGRVPGHVRLWPSAYSPMMQKCKAGYLLMTEGGFMSCMSCVGLGLEKHYHVATLARINFRVNPGMGWKGSGAISIHRVPFPFQRDQAFPMQALRHRYAEIPKAGQSVTPLKDAVEATFGTAGVDIQMSHMGREPRESCRFKP